MNFGSALHGSNEFVYLLACTRFVGSYTYPVVANMRF